jgi:hypothetical protein
MSHGEYREKLTGIAWLAIGVAAIILWIVWMAVLFED